MVLWRRPREQFASSQLFQRPSKLRLENDQNGQDAQGEHLVHEPFQRIQIKPRAERPHNDKEKNPFEQLNRPRAPHKNNEPIDDVTNNEDIDDIFDRIFECQPGKIVQDAYPPSRRWISWMVTANIVGMAYSF